VSNLISYIPHTEEVVVHTKGQLQSRVAQCPPVWSNCLLRQSEEWVATMILTVFNFNPAIVHRNSSPSWMIVISPSWGGSTGHVTHVDGSCTAFRMFSRSVNSPVSCRTLVWQNKIIENNHPLSVHWMGDCPFADIWPSPCGHVTFVKYKYIAYALHLQVTDAYLIRRGGVIDLSSRANRGMNSLMPFIITIEELSEQLFLTFYIWPLISCEQSLMWKSKMIYSKRDISYSVVG